MSLISKAQGIANGIRARAELHALTLERACELCLSETKLDPRLVKIAGERFLGLGKTQKTLSDRSWRQAQVRDRYFSKSAEASAKVFMDAERAQGEAVSLVLDSRAELNMLEVKEFYFQRSARRSALVFEKNGFAPVREEKTLKPSPFKKRMHESIQVKNNVVSPLYGSAAETDKARRQRNDQNTSTYKGPRLVIKKKTCKRWAQQ